MSFTKRRSLSEINLSKDIINNNDDNEDANNENGTRSRVNFIIDASSPEDLIIKKNANPIEHLTASAILFNKIKDGIKIAANENHSNASFMNSSGSHIRSLNHGGRLSLKRKRIFSVKNLRCEIYNILERPCGTLALFYRLFTFALILIPILVNTFTTIHTISRISKYILFYVESFVTVFFFLEYCTRVWSSGYRAAYHGFQGKIKFMSRPLMLVEIAMFASGASILLFSVWQNYSRDTSLINYELTASLLIILRFSQLVRLLYVDRKAHTWWLLIDVISKHKYELITSVYIGFIILLLSSYLIFICEKDENPSLHTYSDAVYWSIITMATIGYGDICPKTFYGKMIATCLCIVGVVFWTLPTGIIGSGFALKVEQKNKREQFNRLVPAAASLIQNWWRMKVIHKLPTNNSSRLVAVLKVYEYKSIEKLNTKDNKQNQKKPVQVQQQSFFMKRKSVQNDENCINNHKKTVDFDETDLFFRKNVNFGHIDANEDENLIYEKNYNEEKEMKNREYLILKLKPSTLILVRIIIMLRFFVAKRKFKLAHKPYDFKDVIEQYTQGNMDILIKIKELQRKLDQSVQLQKNTTAYVKMPHKKDLQPSSPSPLATNNLTLESLKKDVVKLDGRIDSLETRLDRIINLLEQK